MAKLFSSYTLPRQEILHTEFGLIWTTPWPDQKDLFLKLFIREIRNLSYEKLTFFPRRAITKIFFLLHTSYTRYSPYQVWLSLDNSLNRWKGQFLNFANRKNRKFSYEKLTFFIDEQLQKLFFPSPNLHRGYFIPSLVGFGQLLEPMKKTYFWNSLIANFRTKNWHFS